MTEFDFICWVVGLGTGLPFGLVLGTLMKRSRA